MTLVQFLSNLQTPNVTVTLVDLETNNEIATLKASGYAVLDDSIEAKEVKQWTITSASALRVVLGDPA